MKKSSPGAKRFEVWMWDNHLTTRSVSKRLKDHGRQLAKWVSGGRETLSLRLLSELSAMSGIPVEQLATRKQAALVRKLVELSGEKAA